jgi:antirestriction protein ArdC
MGQTAEGWQAPGDHARKRIGGHHYRGIDVPILWHAADTLAFPTNAWLTFKQALDAGGHLKKGEKGTHSVFTKRIGVTDDCATGCLEISSLRAHASWHSHLI